MVAAAGTWPVILETGRLRIAVFATIAWRPATVRSKVDRDPEFRLWVFDGFLSGGSGGFASAILCHLKIYLQILFHKFLIDFNEVKKEQVSIVLL